MKAYLIQKAVRGGSEGGHQGGHRRLEIPAKISMAGVEWTSKIPENLEQELFINQSAMDIVGGGGDAYSMKRSNGTYTLAHNNRQLVCCTCGHPYFDRTNTGWDFVCSACQTPVQI